MTRKIILGLGVALLTFGLLGSDAEAKNKTSDMNDRHAIEMTGAGGFATVAQNQKGTVEVARVKVKNLVSRHLYELKVTVLPAGGNPRTSFRLETSAPTAAGKKGNLEFRKFNVGGLPPGDYRVDVFVTHTHSLDTNAPDPPDPPLSDRLDRDVLLACQPAFFVTVK